MTTITDSTPAGMAAEASRILAEVREARWPGSGEAQKLIGRDFAVAAETLQVYYAVLNDELEPYDLHAPDMGWWDDPKEMGLEFAADQALECAKAARKRLEEYRRSGEAAKGEAA